MSILDKKLNKFITDKIIINEKLLNNYEVMIIILKNQLLFLGEFQEIFSKRIKKDIKNAVVVIKVIFVLVVKEKIISIFTLSNIMNFLVEKKKKIIETLDNES